jgi:hypothetical protein
MRDACTARRQSAGDDRGHQSEAPGKKGFGLNLSKE